MRTLLKQAILSIATITILLSWASCQKVEKQQSVSFYLTYTISTGNGQDMPGTKSSNTDVFDEFYQKIKSGELVAPTYELTFTEKTTGTVYSVNGTWAGKDMVTLRTGTYSVVGTSTAIGESIQDKCSLIFNDEIVVDVNSKTIVLKASYNCSLIIFSDASISKLSNYNGVGTTDFFKFNNYIYAFINNKLYAEGYKGDAYISGTHSNSTQFRIYTGNLNYEIGKFYVYNDINAYFNIEKMEEGGPDSEPISIPCNQIWYTSIDGEIIVPTSGTHFYNSSGAELTYTNIKDGEKWVMTFSDEVAYWSGNWFHNYPGSTKNRLETLGLPKSIDPEKLQLGMDNGHGEYIPFYGTYSKPCIKYFYGDYAGIACDGVLLLSGKDLSVLKAASHTYDGVVSVPNGVIRIAPYAFTVSNMVTSIILPSSIKTLDIYCFEDCTSLTSIYCFAKTCPSVASNCFNMGTVQYKVGILHYPAGSDYSKFTVPSGWSKVGDL